MTRPPQDRRVPPGSRAGTPSPSQPPEAPLAAPRTGDHAPPITLRPATAADAPAIAAILSDWIDETPWMPRVHDPDEDRSFGAFLIERTDVTVAEEMGRVLGFLARRGGEVEALYLAASARGRGIGRALMAGPMAEGRVGLWCFQSNAPARAFYASLGFTETARTDGAGNDEKLPDVRLVRAAEGGR